MFTLYVGLACVLFAAGNLAIGRWVRGRVRDGRSLPRLLRSWQLYAQFPRVVTLTACLQALVGVALVVTGLITWN